MIIWSTSGARLHSGQCNHVTLQLGDIKTKFCLRQPFSFNCLAASMVTTVVRPAAATTQAEHLCPLTHSISDVEGLKFAALPYMLKNASQ